MDEVSASRSGRGRPSVHPVRVQYFESPEVYARIQSVATERSISFAEAQRWVNRLGLEAPQAA